MSGSQAYHKETRDSVVHWVTQHNKEIINQYEKKYLEDSNMCNDGTWATEAEILATASLFKQTYRSFIKVDKFSDGVGMLQTR